MAIVSVGGAAGVAAGGRLLPDIKAARLDPIEIERRPVECSNGEEEPTAMTYQQRIPISTRGHGDMHDLTEQVAAAVNSSGIQTGTVNVFNVGSTSALGTIEFEPGLERDLPAALDRLIPPSRSYGHEQAWHDGNGHSHLQATLLGPSITAPIEDGKLALGTWQQIFHLECDVRPRQRTVLVTVVGDGKT